jgi:hypothetical protein
MNTASTSNTRRLRELIALAAAVVACAFVLAQPASATAKTLNVNPVSGNDTNAGTTAAPLKTIGKSVTLAQAGDTVNSPAGATARA